MGFLCELLHLSHQVQFSELYPMVNMSDLWGVQPGLMAYFYTES